MMIDKERAMMTMHIIAYYYHWGKEELLSLPVSEREKWVELIREQLRAESEQFPTH